MLTKSRVYTLERQYKLIDSSCNATMRQPHEFFNSSYLFLCLYLLHTYDIVFFPVPVLLLPMNYCKCCLDCFDVRLVGRRD